MTSISNSNYADVRQRNMVICPTPGLDRLLMLGYGVIKSHTSFYVHVITPYM